MNGKEKKYVNITEKQLREKIGLGSDELLNTNMGALDIMAVDKGRVTYSFLAYGKLQSESIVDFLDKALNK